MSNDAPKPPAGWYPTPDGEQRFWDGERWANLPVPPSTAEGHSPPKRGRKALIWGIASLTVVVVAGAGIAGVSWKASIDAENLALAEQTAEEDAIAEQAEMDLQNEQAAAEAEAEEERAEEEAERRERERLIGQVEGSIEEMAIDDANRGFIDGQPLSVGCDPVSGGLSDTLTDSTTVFSCFVAVEEYEDGRMRGHYYNATVNWDSYEYTYGYGQP